jgi:hypothetical protein
VDLASALGKFLHASPEFSANPHVLHSIRMLCPLLNIADY